MWHGIWFILMPAVYHLLCYSVPDLPCAAQRSQSIGFCAPGLELLGTTRCRLHLCPVGTHQIHEAKIHTQKQKQVG